MALRVKKRIPIPQRGPLAQRTYRRERRKASIRRIVLSMLSLVVLAIGAGLTYTWYNGEYNATTIQAAPGPKPKIALRAPKQAANIRVGVAIQTLTSPVKPGTNASISIRTNAAAKCTIVVEYNKVPSKDSGLTKKVADDFGMISWAWTVEPGVPKGAWPVIVTCANKKYSGVVNANLVVTP